MEVIKSGNRRESLEAIRDKLAEELDKATGTKAAYISKELRGVLAELEALTPAVGGGVVADLTARIAERRQASGQ